MIEMIEVSNILNNATENSLVIFGRKAKEQAPLTDSQITWAVIEYIADKKLVGAKTLFATHYHEITELEGNLSGVNDYCITVEEHNDDIVSSRK